MGFINRSWLYQWGFIIGGGGGSCCPGRTLHRAPASPGVKRPQWTFDRSRLRAAWTRVSCSLPRPNKKATR